MARYDEPTQTAAALMTASEGFDHLFSNRLREARAQLSLDDTPFHQLGLGVCAFLEAALGMETALMAEAGRCLTLSEAGARKQLKAAKSNANGRFAPGMEWEILQADAIVLLGLTQALSESYTGYIQCMYSLNNAHSKFTKLYKVVFPNGLDSYATPAASPAPTRPPSISSVNTIPASATRGSFFGKWGSSMLAPKPPTQVVQPEGPVEDLIVSGAAFGFGLFNLVFSLLPAKVKSVVGFFGFNSDRRVALQALAVSATRSDVHSVFAGLTLMTYYGVVLLLSGYQADEAHIVKQYRAIVERTSSRYPDGSLWTLNRAKILRMTYDPEGAIAILQEGLDPNRPGHNAFLQAESLLVFELAWTLLSQRRYQEAAGMFLKMKNMNGWSHATYYMITAGCYVSLGDRRKAKEFLDEIPKLLERKKIGGKDLPTEVFIRKKLDFYKRKQKRRGGDEDDFVDCIKISPAEELAIFWNTHARVTQEIGETHIRDLTSLSPAISIKSPYASSPEESTVPDLDTEDEFAVRSLILGVVHRTLSAYGPSREFLEDALRRHPDVEGKWIGGLALFELAVLELKEAEAADAASKSPPSDSDVSASAPRALWKNAIRAATEKLDKAVALSGSNVDLSSRLDTRVAMLRDEIVLKKEMMGISD